MALLLAVYPAAAGCDNVSRGRDASVFSTPCDNTLLHDAIRMINNDKYFKYSQ